jgi:D-aspartate ligase
MGLGGPHSDRLRGPPKRPGALVLNGAYSSLGLARSLGRRGIEVWYLDDGHWLPRFSRYVARSFNWPGPQHRDALPFLLDLARNFSLSGWVLFPGGDPEMQLVAENHQALASVFRLITADWPRARITFDKSLTYQRAAELGIDHPHGIVPAGVDDLVAQDLTFPVILKPTVRNSWNAFTIDKAWRADNSAELLARYRDAAALVGTGNIVVQEYIAGGGVGQLSYAGVWDRGRPVGTLVARRRRQYPIEFGASSTFVETIDCPPVEEAATRFLRSLDFTGMVESEFKYDARDGRYKLLDVNARPWTWIGLGGRAGVDFAYLAWRVAAGESVQPCHATPGVAWVDAVRDPIAGLQEIGRGRIGLADYLSSYRQRLVFASFALDDPLPGLLELPLLFWRRGIRRLARGARRLVRRAPSPGAAIGAR